MAQSTLRLLTSSTHYHIESASALLKIDRLSQQITLADDTTVSSTSSSAIVAVFGVLELFSGPYLIVINSSKQVATLGDHHIHEAEDITLLPFAKSLDSLTSVERKAEELCLASLTKLLNAGGFFFSFTYDVTSTQVQQAQKRDTGSSLFDKTDTRFFWNRRLLQPLLDLPERAHHVVVPVAYGFCRSQTLATLDGQSYTFALISRRAVGRAGTRYHCRGVDAAGHCANYIETEQIITAGGLSVTYSQVRGSIPIFWGQQADLRYKPAFHWQTSHDSEQACRRHLSDLTTRFGAVLAVNLVNKTGGEAPLGRQYEDCLTRLTTHMPLDSIWFDFHQECKNMQWQNLDKLMTATAQFRAATSVSIIDISHRTLLQRQRGVVRTNCIDVLDRTNVVQTMVAKEALAEQLRVFQTQLGMSPSHDGAWQDAWPGLAAAVTNIWADHGDECSIQYSGTPAQKSDFTRTGKRTMQGLLRDGYFGALRYFHNNFFDASKQDAMALLLEQASIRRDNGRATASKLIDDDRPFMVKILPLIAMACVSVIVIGLFLPSSTLKASLHVLALLALLASLISIGKRGKQYVANPKLSATSSRLNTGTSSYSNHIERPTIPLESLSQAHVDAVQLSMDTELLLTSPLSKKARIGNTPNRAPVAVASDTRQLAPPPLSFSDALMSKDD
eukprot:m.168663 g.168663  ORF g.168663 m.168663 type:complete len:673 (+) comp16653_c0_seq3:148-2166(+)